MPAFIFVFLLVLPTAAGYPATGHRKPRFSQLTMTAIPDLAARNTRHTPAPAAVSHPLPPLPSFTCIMHHASSIMHRSSFAQAKHIVKEHRTVQRLNELREMALGRLRRCSYPCSCLRRGFHADCPGSTATREASLKTAAEGGGVNATDRRRIPHGHHHHPSRHHQGGGDGGGGDEFDACGACDQAPPARGTVGDAPPSHPRKTRGPQRTRQPQNRHKNGRRWSLQWSAAASVSQIPQ